MFIQGHWMSALWGRGEDPKQPVLNLLNGIIVSCLSYCQYRCHMVCCLRTPAGRGGVVMPVSLPISNLPLPRYSGDMGSDVAILKPRRPIQVGHRSDDVFAASRPRSFSFRVSRGIARISGPPKCHLGPL